MSVQHLSDRRAAVYCRVSHNSQGSIPDQIAWATSYAAAHDLAVVWDGAHGRPFRDEGFSGDDATRAGLARLEAFYRDRHAAGAPVTRLIVWHVDRVSRSDALDTFALYAQLRSHGLRYVHTRDRTIDLHNALDRTLLGIEQDHKAHPFLKDHAARVLGGMAGAVRAGFWVGLAPFGYRVEKVPGAHGAGKRRRSGRLAIDPVKGPLVTELFRRYAAGEGSTNDLAAWLDTQARPPRARAWCSQVVYNVLTRAVYVGTVVFGKVPQGKHARLADGGATVSTDGGGGGIAGSLVIKGAVPPLTDEATFRLVQDRLAAGKRRGEAAKRPPLPLAGLGRCGSCGHLLHAANTRAPRKAGKVIVPTLACGARLRFAGVCRDGSAGTPHDAVLAKVLRVIGEQVLAGDFPERVTRDVEGRAEASRGRREAERSNLEGRVGELESALARSAYRLATVAEDMVAALQDGIRQAREELDELRRRLAALDDATPGEEPPIDPARVRAFFDGCRAAVAVKVEGPEAGALLNRLLHAITDGFTLHFRRSRSGRVTPDRVEVALPVWVTRALATSVYPSCERSVVLSASF